MNKNVLFLLVTTAITSVSASAESNHSSIHEQISDQDIAKQYKMLTQNTQGKGFGPQSPRDIDSNIGNNSRAFGATPAYTEMNLCNIHFHKNAEHKGGEFTRYAGNGDGKGYQSGYLYSGHLDEKELTQVKNEICPSKHGSLFPGDTIEVHYVHSTAQINPGPTLGSCLNESINNPQLRVETQVYVLVNDQSARDFGELTQLNLKKDLHQASNIPNDTGTPIQYAGSTTGPDYNEKGSPFQVTWSVRPKIAKVNINTVGQWCKGNAFNEDHAHGVRNLVTDPALLSKIVR